MDANEFTPLVLLAVGGEISGRTKLQKTVYFLAAMTGNLADLGYSPHFYGPFSTEVADAAERLCALGLAQKTTVGVGVSGRGFEVVRHDYRLTDDGRSLAERKARARPDAWERLRKAVEVFKAAGERHYMDLSIAAKAHCLLAGAGQPTTADELARLAARFGWSVSADDVRNAVDYLRKLRLVA